MTQQIENYIWYMAVTLTRLCNGHHRVNGSVLSSVSVHKCLGWPAYLIEENRNNSSTFWYEGKETCSRQTNMSKG